jgi:hypothetical protein
VKLRRRAFVLSAFAAGSGAGDPRFRLTPAPGGRVALSGPGLAGAAWLPAARARLLAEPVLRGAAVDSAGDGRCALVAFAADAGPDSTSDLVAVIAAPPAGPRIVALELLAWRRRADGAHLATRISVIPDGSGLILARAAARPGADGRSWRREAWTDYLRWAPQPPPGGPMRDAPARPPLPGTWQAALAARRAMVRAMLATPRASPDAALLATAADGAPSGGGGSLAGLR